MNKVYISKSTTKVKSEKSKHSKGSNWPTYITTYECFCKKGSIIEERCPGFDDHFATLKCRRCNKKYSSFLDFSGNDWIAYEKED